MGAGTLKKTKYTFKKRKRRLADPAAFDAAVDLVLAGKPLTPQQLKDLDAGRNDYFFMLSLERQDESSSAILETPSRPLKIDRNVLLKLATATTLQSAGFALVATWLGAAAWVSTDPPKKREKKRKKSSKANGRRGQGDFPNAKRVRVSHPTLMPGMLCSTCGEGKVYLLSRLGQFRQFVGNPMIEVTFYELEEYRCNNAACEAVFRAPLPEGMWPEIYDPTAISTVAVAKYGMGLPFIRQERFFEMMGTPLSHSTQWDLMKAAAGKLRPVWEYLLWTAAQGRLGYFDDTSVTIRKVAREEDDARTGVFTTGILSVSEAYLIALYLSGTKHAGENWAELLAKREPEELPMLQMSDALAANFSKLSKKRLILDVIACCLLHGRRKFVALMSSFPDKCGHVIRLIGKVYHNDEICKERGYNDEERLDFHQRKSGPVMEKLRKWLDKMVLRKKVEENSRLGEAIAYMRKHWRRLTLFLRVSGIPLDNNPAERILKTAVLNRKNSLFYQTEGGSQVGDFFMSIIQTCRLNGVNAYDYLSELLRNHQLAADQPEHWMPWKYKETLDAKTQTP